MEVLRRQPGAPPPQAPPEGEGEDGAGGEADAEAEAAAEELLEGWELGLSARWAELLLSESVGLLAAPVRVWPGVGAGAMEQRVGRPGRHALP